MSMTIWQRIGRWALGEGGEGLSDARLIAGWQKTVAPPSSEHRPTGLPPKPPIRVELTASGLTDEMVERAREAGARWFHEHDDGASSENEWRDHYRAVLEASLCESQSADRESPPRGRSDR